MPPTPSGPVPRDPAAETRTRRALSQLGDIINSLVRDGSIQFVGGGRWQLDPRITRPPGPVVLFEDAGGSDPLVVPGERGPQGVPGPAGASASAGGASLYFPDLTPAAPDAADDEFTDGALGAAWTDWDVGGRMAYAEGSYGAELTQTDGGTDSYAGIFRSVPAGDFAVACRVSLAAVPLDFVSAGIAVAEDLSANPATGDFTVFGLTYRSTGLTELRVDTFTNYQTFGSTQTTVAVRGHSALYLRVRSLSGVYSLDFSADGQDWARAYAFTPGFTVSKLALVVNSNTGSGVPAVARFRFFRKLASTAFGTPLLGNFSGVSGPQGPVGPPGLPGEDGETPPAVPGERGATGAAGAAGAAGASGTTGAVGPMGLQGEDGEAPPAQPGERGPTGATGATGAAGATGATGPVLLFDRESDDAPLGQVPRSNLPGHMSTYGWSVVSAYMVAASQALTSLTYNTINLDTEVRDPDGIFDPTTHAVTPKESGTYLVTFGSQVSGSSGRIVAAVLQAGAAFAAISDGTNVFAGGTILVRLTGGTAYTFGVFPTNAGVAGLGGQALTYLEMYRVF